MLLCYLDAHWQDDLPLAEELELILSSDRASVIIIDDFAVPFDPEYQYDDYGPGKVLNLEMLSHVVPKGAALFFPALPAREETGARRGCAVISVGHITSHLDSLSELRRHDWPSIGKAVVPTAPKNSLSPNLEALHRLVKSRELEINLSSALTEAARLHGEIEVLRKQHDASQASAATLHQAHSRSQAEVDVLRASASWRVTAPLRAIKRFLSG